MPHAYIVGQIRVKDADRWADYCSQVPATLEPWHAELMFRGTKDTTFAGETPYTNIVVIRFPDITTARAWHNSEAYQALVPLRESAAEVLLSGFEDTTMPSATILEGIARGEQSVLEGQTYSQNEAREKMDKWLK